MISDRLRLKPSTHIQVFHVPPIVQPRMMGRHELLDGAGMVRAAEGGGKAGGSGGGVAGGGSRGSRSVSNRQPSGPNRAIHAYDRTSLQSAVELIARTCSSGTHAYTCTRN